ncbi:DNA binding domain of tn916 integrase [Butyrivibrio sp. YAB3001]|nr:integrase DNA-binding domain-containing protein [Butyrivibrio sp. YAB3001]SFC34684.1 DNA binding domain of tn916 integrase [Butyrivibrio sp. YAB3001]
MSERRRDKRGRILHNGEMQMYDGRYRFKYVDENGKEKAVYSWRLDHNDATPAGKKRDTSLREKEKKIQADIFDHIVPAGNNLSVLSLVEKYIATKTGVRPTTRAGYKTVVNILKKDAFGKKRIDTVRISDAKNMVNKTTKERRA